MRLTRLKFNVRQLMLAVAIVAFLLVYASFVGERYRDLLESTVGPSLPNWPKQEPQIKDVSGETLMNFIGCYALLPIAGGCGAVWLVMNWRGRRGSVPAVESDSPEPE